MTSRRPLLRVRTFSGLIALAVVAALVPATSAPAATQERGKTKKEPAARVVFRGDGENPYNGKNPENEGLALIDRVVIDGRGETLRVTYKPTAMSSLESKCLEFKVRGYWRVERKKKQVKHWSTKVWLGDSCQTFYKPDDEEAQKEPIADGTTEMTIWWPKRDTSKIEGCEVAPTLGEDRVVVEMDDRCFPPKARKVHWSTDIETFLYDSTNHSFFTDRLDNRKRMYVND